MPRPYKVNKRSGPTGVQGQSPWSFQGGYRSPEDLRGGNRNPPALRAFIVLLHSLTAGASGPSGAEEKPERNGSAAYRLSTQSPRVNRNQNIFLRQSTPNAARLVIKVIPITIQNPKGLF